MAGRHAASVRCASGTSATSTLRPEFAMDVLSGTAQHRDADTPLVVAAREAAKYAPEPVEQLEVAALRAPRDFPAVVGRPRALGELEMIGQAGADALAGSGARAAVIDQLAVIPEGIHARQVGRVLDHRAGEAPDFAMDE